MCIQKWLLIAASFLAASPALSQSAPLGLRFTVIELSYGGLVSDMDYAAVRMQSDFQITTAHGLQLDGALISYPKGTLGQIDLHLYMEPDAKKKYGLFASLGDVGGREATIGSVGVEGMFTLGTNTLLEAKAEIGLSTHMTATRTRENLDFDAITLGASHRLGRSLKISAQFAVAQIEELHLKATNFDSRLGVQFDMPLTGAQIDLKSGYMMMKGVDAQKGEIYAQVGLTWQLGQKPQRPTRSAFTMSQPFDQLLRRQLF